MIAVAIFSREIKIVHDICVSKVFFSNWLYHCLRDLFRVFRMREVEGCSEFITKKELAGIKVKGLRPSSDKSRSTFFCSQNKTEAVLCVSSARSQILWSEPTHCRTALAIVGDDEYSRPAFGETPVEGNSLHSHIH